MYEHSRYDGRMQRPRLIPIVVMAACICVAATFAFVPKWTQDQAYHRFADTRTMLGIPNALNVLSNVPFVLVGLLVLWRTGNPACGHWTGRIACPTFGLGLILTGLGSAVYHWSPSDSTLILDRAGMIVALMATVALLLDSSKALIVAELIGVASLVVWQLTGDLRLYGVVQFFPVVIMVLLLLGASRGRDARAPLAVVMGCYAIAKVFEMYDRQIFDALDIVSGHTLKHLAAAAATLAIWWWARQPLAEESSPPDSLGTSSPARATTT
jgi:hypothetical protein